VETSSGEAVVEVGEYKVNVHDRFLDDIERLFGSGVLRLG
jgi:hypothetical protein